jgi:hypothetical protein
VAEPDPPDPDGLTPDLVERVKANICRHCGGSHARACPRVRRLAFHPNGALSEVEFWKTWPDDHVIWPEDLPDPEDPAPVS